MFITSEPPLPVRNIQKAAPEMSVLASALDAFIIGLQIQITSQA